MEGSGRGLEGLRKTTENLSGYPVTGLRFESGPSRIRSRSANHSAAMFVPLSEYGWQVYYNWMTSLTFRVFTYVNYLISMKRKIFKHTFVQVSAHEIGRTKYFDC
jgi:hypothetical protein